MPPAQCPACGRFLKNSFVAALADDPAPCPGCDEQLRPEHFGDERGSEAASEPASPTQRAEDELHDRGGSDAAAGDDGPGTPDEPSSVRPPDLPPEDVRDTGDDVLRGWDPQVEAAAGGARLDRPPFPTDTVVVAGAGAAGLLLGLAVGRERRAVAAVTGAVAGVTAGAVARRVWRLET